MAAPPNLATFLEAERIQESGNNYQASNASGASGAYQMIFGTWQTAMRLAKLEASVFFGQSAAKAPASVQDAAAAALMTQYYNQFGGSWFNVAEAWYGGPGAVGNPTLGGGPGYPDVGQYATEVMATFNQLLANAGGPTGPTPPGVVGPFVNFNQVAAAIATEQSQRGLGDQHSREQAAAALATEAASRGAGDAHTREQAAAAFAVEAAARSTGDAHSREQAAAGIAAEALARSTGDAHSREQAAAGIKALDDQLTAQIAAVLKYAQTIPGLVDQRAAAGYDPTLRARANALTKLLDTVVAHDPLVAGLVSNLATFVIDLAGVEDPILRIAAQLVLKQVIDRLGVNTALHAMLSDLVGGILGGGQPKTLQAVMGDVGNRLDALESGQAELAPLAPEADQLHELGTLIFDAGLLAYFAGAVADPVATANDTVTVFAPITGPLLAPVRAMLGMP